MRILLSIIIALIGLNLNSQSIETCELNTIQTLAKVDTFVIPDAIYLGITTHEKETSKELDVLERKIISKLQELKIDTESSFSYTDFGSRLKSKLFGKDIKQTRKYEIRLISAEKAITVITELNELNIGRIQLLRFKYIDEESLKLELSKKAIVKARLQAVALTEPINQGIGRAIQIMDINDNEINQFSNSFSGLRQEFVRESEHDKESPEFKKIKFVKSIFVTFELK